MSTYYNQLHPWCIIHCLPSAQTLIIARFRRRSEAEAHLRVLHRLNPNATYTDLKIGRDRCFLRAARSAALKKHLKQHQFKLVLRDHL